LCLKSLLTLASSLLLNFSLLHFFIGKQHVDYGSKINEAQAIVQRIDHLVDSNRKLQKACAGEGYEVDFSQRAILSLDQVPAIGKLVHIKILNLQKNNLSTVPKEIIHLVNIEVLDLSYNSITILPLKLSKLSKLRVLDVSHNMLDYLPKDVVLLPSLKQLEFSNSMIKQNCSFFENYGKFQQSSVCLIYGQVYVPKEIVCPGGDSIIGYFQEMEKGEEEISRIKLSIIGNQGVGKTTLINSLFNSEAHTPNTNYSPTHGVVQTWHDLTVEDIKGRAPQKITVCVYDFGADQMCLDLLLTRRTIYLVVFNVLENEERYSKITHNLSLLHEKISNPVPIILIGTHADLCTQTYLNKVECDLQYLFDYPYLQAIIFVNAKEKGQGVKIVEKRILEIANENRWKDQKVPSSYMKTEKLIISHNLPLTYPVINELYFYQNCHESNLDAEHVTMALKFLSYLGSIVYSPPLVILDPQWASETLRRQPPTIGKRYPLFWTLTTDRIDTKRQISVLGQEIDNLGNELTLLLNMIDSMKSTISNLPIC